MGRRFSIRLFVSLLALFIQNSYADPFPPSWSGGAGAAIHYDPVNWPSEPVDPLDCGDTCGDWKPYTRFQQTMNDPRTNDPSNGGTSPQAYVNVASSCSDTAQPSIYYYLHQGATEADDVLMFRWRVESSAHSYATGPNAGSYGSSHPWSSALWTVLFDIDGSGYRSLAAHLDGSSGSPSSPIDMLVGIWGNTPSHTLDYVNDPNIHLLGHNPTAFIGTGGKILNFQSALNPTETWANGSSETTWDYGTTRARQVSRNSCTEYFIDYQIPIALLDASGVGGPSITRDTPISMLFCTANSLNNPFQKDCAINREWSANTTVPAPFGDYLSFNQTEPYSQPIIAKVEAVAPASCPGTYALTATVQDTLALQNGVVEPSVQAVDFYYWFDGDGDGEANDVGSEWIRITPAASLDSGSLNTWSADWDAGSLPKGKYLIGAQALDDNTQLDDGMAPTGINNRTFSYLTGDLANKIYINGAWSTGQEAAFPDHSPAQGPAAGENWYGNPDVTGQQLALVGTAINACGVAPTLELSADVSNVVAGGSVTYTIALANPGTNSEAVTVSEVSHLLPAGFSYQSATTSGTGGLGSSDPTVSGQTLTWSYGSPVSLAPGASATLSFTVTATSTSGMYNASASATTSFGPLSSDPVAVAVDAARLSFNATPSAYSVPADGATQLTFTFTYANDSTVLLTAADIAATLPAGATYVGCSGGVACSNNSGNLSWTIGDLAGGATGGASFTVTVPGSWSTSSITASATLSASAPDSSTATRTASASAAVTGISFTSPAGFTLTKTASARQIAPGDSVTYTIAYENYGGTAADNVAISDTLPGGMNYVSSTGGGVHSGGTVSWSLGTVAAGVSGSVTVTVTADNPFTAANPSVNSATIDWTGGATVTSSGASVGVTGQACSTYYFRSTTADVGFDGAQQAATTLPVPVAGDTGGSVTVSAPVSGAAYLEALRFYQDPATTNDVPFDGNITTNMYIDRANGQGLYIRTTVYDYDSASGATTQLAQDEQLFNGSTKGLLTFSVTPSGTLAKNHRLLWVYEVRSAHSSQTVEVQLQYAGTVANAISGGTTFANSNAEYCVTPPASLSANISVDTASINEGATPTLTYTIDYANSGSASATTSTLESTLPGGFTNCEYSTDNSIWSACSGGGAHTFGLGTLAGGAGGTLYIRGDVPAGTTGGDTLTNTVSLSSDQTASVTANADTVVIGAGGGGGTPSVVLNLSASATAAVPGEAVVYTLVAVNIGDASATNVVVSNALPLASYFTYDSCTGGCSNAAGTLSWNLGTLAAGASQTYTYTMNIGSTGLSAGITEVTDDAQVSGDAGVSGTSNSVSLSIDGNPALVGTISAVPDTGLAPGDTITYLATVDNTGSATATGVTVSNPIPGFTQFAGSLTSSVGSATFDTVNNRVVIALGDIAAGVSTSFSYDVTVGKLDSGNTTIVNTATASAGNAAQEVFSASASASAAAQLELTQTLSGSGAYPSATLVADANGTTVFVDRTDRFYINQQVKIGAQVRQIVSLGASTLTLDSAVTANSGDPMIGALTLALNFRNTGNADATGVELTGTLPAGLGFYSAASALSAPAEGDSGAVTWTIGTLTPNAGGTRSVTVFPTGVTGAFTVQGLLEASNASDATADLDVTIGGISVTKATTTSLLSAGGTASYTVILTNTLTTPVNSVDVTDTLPDGFAYLDNSATVGGVPTEPTFDASDTAQQQPLWSGLTVPASGSLDIAFDVSVSADAGATAYQNEVDVSVPAGVGLSGFDALRTKTEDVNVLAAGTGSLKGYVFFRDSGAGATYDPLADTPLGSVRVEIYQTGADCSDPYSATCYVVHTDTSGYFEQVLAAGDWYVNVVASGDLDAGWTQDVGSNDELVTVPDQDSVEDHNGYVIPAGSYTVSASAGTGGSIDPASRAVTNGDTTTFIVIPDTGYSVDTVTGTCGGSLSGDTYTTDAITAACSVIASFALNSYTVAFDLGGGTHTGGGALSQTVLHGGSATAPMLTPPAGKTFSSWSASLDSITSDVTITALYVDISYTVTFNMDGGTHTGGGALSQTITHAGAATEPALTAPVGKTFNGWSTGFGSVTSDLTVTALYSDVIYTVTFDLGGGTHTGGGALSQTITHGNAATAPTLTAPTGKAFSTWSAGFASVTSDLTITALYSDITYAVTFNLDGGSRTGGGALSQTVAHGSAATAPTLTAPTGKTFTGWSAGYGSVTSDLTVTALYSDITYTVTFNLDGGTRTGGGALSQTITHGGAAIAPTLTTPTGKTFTGWSAGFSSVTGDLSVTALYSDVTYTVTFDLDGGTHTGGGALSQTITHGGGATAPALTAPTGKTFAAWNAGYGSVTSDLTVTALYSDITYAVTFNLEGGTRTGGGALSQTITHGSPATAPTLAAPTGKTFTGWNVDFASVTGDLTVSALYGDLTYTVTFDLNGGTRTGGGALVQTVAHGAAATEPALTAPGDKTFTGWSASFTSVTGDITITAQFADDSYTVSVSAGAGGSASPTGDQTVTHGQSLLITLTPDTGFVVSSVTGDCTGTRSGNSYTIAAVVTNCSVAFGFTSELKLVDDDGNAYEGETLRRNQSRRFRVSGGSDIATVSAIVLQGGGLTVFDGGSVEDFFTERGATLTDNGDGTYSFTARRAGSYSLTFVDEDGQEVSVTFVIHPSAAFTSTYQTGVQGLETRVSLLLDDDPIEYPVVVPYTVQNNSYADGLDASGNFTIDSGRQAQLILLPNVDAGSITFYLEENGLQNSNLGGLVIHRIDLLPAALAPVKLALGAVQGNEPVTVALAGGGPVDLTTLLGGDGYSYDWSGSDRALGIAGASGGSIAIDPAGLDGSYRVSVTVTELAAPNRSFVSEFYLRVVTEVPEAYIDFYGDQTDAEASRLPICIEGGMERVAACRDEQNAIYMETLDAYALRLGHASDFASWRDQQFALSVEPTDIVDDTGHPVVNHLDRQYDHLGYRVDFELTGLERAGQSVPVVIPLKPGLAIGADNVWRKYRADTGWQTFVEDDRNSLWSAARGTDGLCPWPAADDWRLGLNSGDDCVRLIIEDGGPNDADNSANGVIRDPGTLAVSAERREVTTVGKGKGSGSLGAIDLWILALLFFTGLVSYVTRVGVFPVTTFPVTKKTRSCRQ